MSDFTEHREAVIDYIRKGIESQGGSKVEAISATTCIYFWGSDEVEDLFKCINSELPEHVIGAIVAHDFNGLSRGDECFLPKSYQFREEHYALPC
jgi:hypothetical protein